jgi:hypothetical protein
MHVIPECVVGMAQTLLIPLIGEPYSRHALVFYWRMTRPKEKAAPNGTAGGLIKYSNSFKWKVGSREK